MKRKFEVIGLIIVWFAVLAQLYLIIQNRQATILETLIRFFSFFTVLTNTMVALYFTTLVLKLKKFPFSILASKGALTAITTFILIVGLMYQLVLRGIWLPTGMQYIVDELLHSIVPVYVLIYWCFNVDYNALQLNNLLYWLLYPTLYLIFIIIRGYFSGFYPYPFLNIADIGLLKALQNIGVIIGVTMILFGLLVFIGNQIIRKRFKTNDSKFNS